MFANDSIETDEYSKRQLSILRLSKMIWSMTDEVYRPPVPMRTTSQGGHNEIDAWVAAAMSEFARASRMGSMQNFAARFGSQLGWNDEKVLSTLATMLRLAPEFFAFFLLVWQLAKERP